MNASHASKTFLLLVVIAITAVFLSMIRPFIMAVLLAGIFASLAGPVYRRFMCWFGDRAPLASIATLLVIVLLIILPLGSLVGIVTTQAVGVANAVAPWVQQKLANPDEVVVWLQQQPYYDRIAPYEDDILLRLGEIVTQLSRFLVSNLSQATSGTVQFFFMLFIMLYAMYFFLISGGRLMDRILYYIPLADKDERRLLDKFSSVTRATIRGTAVIGGLQGGLAGVAFFVVGIPSALFWAVIMMVLSIIPGIGTALVWVPAAAILAAGGAWGKAIGLTIFCGGIVGSIDNVLRPRLVGRDTEMPDLLILLSTLGGISLFGILGFIIGPIVAALFVTVWEIYGVVFRDVLPPGRYAPEVPMEDPDVDST
ncbi:AI-2E family transporter [bacterium]|nr:MAG: AI-2E family transporter [bacterium]